MIGTGALATGPTALAALFTIGLATEGAFDDTAVGADDFLAGGTLADTVVAADVTLAVEGHGVRLAVASIAIRALDAAGVAVACDMEGGLSLAIAEVDLCHSNGS